VLAEQVGARPTEQPVAVAVDVESVGHLVQSVLWRVVKTVRCHIA